MVYLFIFPCGITCVSLFVWYIHPGICLMHVHCKFSGYVFVHVVVWPNFLLFAIWMGPNFLQFLVYAWVCFRSPQTHLLYIFLCRWPYRSQAPGFQRLCPHERLGHWPINHEQSQWDHRSVTALFSWSCTLFAKGRIPTILIINYFVIHYSSCMENTCFVSQLQSWNFTCGKLSEFSFLLDHLSPVVDISRTHYHRRSLCWISWTTHLSRGKCLFVFLYHALYQYVWPHLAGLAVALAMVCFCFCFCSWDVVPRTINLPSIGLYKLLRDALNVSSK